jgi:hypothetical protein
MGLYFSSSFSFTISEDIVENFKGMLPSKFESPQKLWEHIKYHCENIESFELERLCFDVDYNGFTNNITINEIVNDPLNDEFPIEF